jgi:eukaryotic-like serine/threonine-protein kinase
MTAPKYNHPDRSDLEAFGVGLFDPAHSAVLEQHVADCPSCCDAVQKAPDDTLVNQLREAVTLPPQAAPAGPVPSGQDTVGLPSAAADAPVEPPADLARHPRYRLLKLLGAGGMGAVYQAEHGVMRRLVALKVINREYTSNPAAAERFQREIRAAAQLHHPNIVAAYDAEQAGDTHFLVMEYIDGVNLARLVAEKGPLPVAEACEYVRQAALGLQHAHERGMVHRDVKPHNLIRSADGVVKLLDFGLASVVECGEGQLTGTNAIMGTPDYIAPEQAEDTHAADARSDIYSLGCTLYHLLTGRPPFTYPSTLLKLVAHREEAPAPVRAVRPDVPEELAAVLSRMMAKAPVDRYQTAAEVAAGLAPFADATALPKPRPKSRRRLWVAAAVAAVCMAGLAAAVAAVVVHIQTDQGEVTIQTDDPNIEVVVTKGGKLVRIVDPQSKQTWQLDPEKFELSMAEQPDGLNIALDGKTPFILKRKDGKLLVTVTRGPATAPAEITNSIGMKLKLIKAGKFLMGSPKDEEGRYDEEGPRHEVEITKSFYMSVYPVTRGQFAAFVKAAEYQTEGEADGKGGYGLNTATAKWEQKPEYIWRNPGFKQGDDHPVVEVSWNDATAFCAWLSKKEGKHYELPTEAEWEYACRAGTKTRFWCGDADASLKGNANIADASCKEKNPDVSWAVSWDDGYAFTSPVGSFKANPWGLYDMHGNVWQWCADYYDAKYYENSDKQDPFNSSKSNSRVLRGGSWSLAPRDCRSAHRSYNDLRFHDNGFRVVLRSPARTP